MVDYDEGEIVDDMSEKCQLAYFHHAMDREFRHDQLVDEREKREEAKKREGEQKR